MLNTTGENVEAIVGIPHIPTNIYTDTSQTNLGTSLKLDTSLN